MSLKKLERLHNWLPLLFSLFVVSACTEEDPTEVGDDLLPSGDVRTFELILDAATFTTSDTTFGGFTRLQEAPFLVIANKFEGVLDANVLLRLADRLPSISVRNAAG